MNHDPFHTEHGIAIALCDAEELGPRAICSVALPSGGGAPEWVELIPAGEVPSRDGRAPWKNSDPHAVVAASQALRMDLPVDYEHQTDYAARNGQPAPAAGWIKELAVRDGAIWGRVEWTERARAMLSAREYRYLSPVFNHTKAGRRVVQVLRAALTNDPALYLTALAKTEESDVDPKLKKVLDLLALGEDVDETVLAKAIADLQDAGKALATVAKAAGLDRKIPPTEAAPAIAAALNAKGDAGSLKAIARAAGLDETASAEAIETAVAKAVAGTRPDPSQFVPRSEFDQVRTALAKLQEEQEVVAEEKAAAAVDEAIETGKVTPGQRDWWLVQARSDPDGFAKYVKDAPVILKPGSSSAAKKPAAADGPLDETERAVCRATGLSEEEYRKSRAQLAGDEEEAA